MLMECFMRMLHVTRRGGLPLASSLSRWQNYGSCFTFFPKMNDTADLLRKGTYCNTFFSSIHGYATSSSAPSSSSSLRRSYNGETIKLSEMDMIKNRGLESRLQLISRRGPDRLRAGDIIRVKRKFMESSNRSLQFTGICMAINRRGLGSSLLVRSVIDRVGIEQTFPVFSPLITQIDIVKRGRFRKAKLYFLRKRSTKKLPYPAM